MKLKKKKLLILEGSDFSKDALILLKSKFKVHVNYKKNNLSDRILKNVEYLFVRLNHKIDKNFLTKTNKLKYIISPTTGINHIDSEEIIKKKNYINFT